MVRPILKIFAPVGIVLTLLAGAAQAESRAPILGAATGFHSGTAQARLRGTVAMGLGELRDGLRWADIESMPGAYRFDTRSGRSISDLAATGLLGSLTLHPTSPLWDDGKTIVTEMGIRKFADYVTAIADQFPNVDLEITNEINSRSFVSGTAKAMSPLERARLNARYLAELNRQPALRGRRILGGGAHSIAAGYLWELLDHGAGAHMDAVVVHPYTSPAEALPRHIEVLRRHPAMADLDIEVTEFGTRDLPHAIDDFWRQYCGLAQADVTRVVWYPMEERKDGYASLLGPNFAPTALGRTVSYVAQNLAGRQVQPIRPNAAVYGCVFDQRLAVLWGDPREVLIDDDIIPLDAELTPLATTPRLARDRVLILRRRDGRPLDMSKTVRYGPSTLVVDSFDSFVLPQPGAPAGTEAGFLRLLEINGKAQPLATCPGQDRPRAPWFPYLCSPNAPGFVLHETGLQLQGAKARNARLIHRHVTSGSSQFYVKVTTSLQPASLDGVQLDVAVDGRVIDQRIIEGDHTTHFDLPTLPVGTRLDIGVSPGATVQGDIGKLRISIHRGSPPGP